MRPWNRTEHLLDYDVRKGEWFDEEDCEYFLFLRGKKDYMSGIEVLVVLGPP